MARPREHWLLSEDHERWADAIMACQSGAPWDCGAAGECQLGGHCFTTDRQAACAAWRMIARLSSDNEAVQRHLDRAVEFLRYGEAR